MSVHKDVDDVGEFAALLRALKQRTDRSYGSLARRLAMNTSTLHRYCAGEAVPVDFAPVERFAALCGATAEERLELHRRWLLAAAARQRPRGTATSGTEADGSAGSGAESGGPATRKGEADGSATSSGEADGSAEVVGGAAGPARHAEAARSGGAARSAGTPQDAGAAEGAGAAPGAGAARGAGTQRDPGAPSSAGAVHEPGASVNRGEGPEGAALAAGTTAVALSSAGAPLPRRPWHRRRRLTAGIAAAGALLAVLGGIAALPDGRRAAADDRTRAAAPADPGPEPTGRKEPHGSSPSPGGSPGPKRSAPPTAAEKGGKKKGRKDDRTFPSPSGRAGTPSQKGTPAAVPLTWSADSQAWQHGCGHDYVVAKPPSEVPPPPVPQDAGTWAASQGAVHAGETLVRLSVQGRTDTAVVLEDLRVRVVGRTTPVKGNAFAMNQGCGGALTPRSFDVDLDKDRPIARAVAGSDAGTPIPAVRMPYRVSARDPEVLLVTAGTRSCDCRWYLELDWSSQGRRGTVRIDDHGRPFRTSALKGLPRYLYDTSARTWAPYR
ncbi:helix-turn-helix domain-containing protein [Streptomyces sp. NPDC059720]|uniref:helix-turn-helix domain-containing protein n=1 Tax=Streptomyces sp. NPDC059720 TaxID=3346924 RepID=UPI003673810A